MAGSASMDHDLPMRRRQAGWKHHQEGSRSWGKQPITNNLNKNQPTRHSEQKRVNKTQKKYSAINTAEFRAKAGLVTWSQRLGWGSVTASQDSLAWS